MLNILFNRLPRGFVAFACVGTVGFIVDATVLTTMISYYGWDHYSARVVSFGTAVLVTWFLNRQWTFRHQASDNKTREYSAYLAIQTVGALINFCVYSAGIYFSSTLMEHPVLPLAIGSLVAMLFNFTASKRYAFTG